MSCVDTAIERIDEILEEITRLKQSDFPYDHSLDALKHLEKKIKDQKSILEKTDPDSRTGSNAGLCSTSLEKLQIYVPIFGFILRSTNVRNAFEAYKPVQRLAQSLMCSDTKLIISSEWEYMPLVYCYMRDLPGFVLIGLPAPESSNPLLIPLAGHELGHAIWKEVPDLLTLKIEIGDKILSELWGERWEEYELIYPQYDKEDLRSDIFGRRTWAPALALVESQIEEIFCDFLGLKLFSESYMYAFEYMLSPGKPNRSLKYPGIRQRVENQMVAAKSMGITTPPEFGADFIAEDEPDEPTMKLFLSIADKVSASLVPDLIKMAEDFVGGKDVPEKDPMKVSQICEYFRRWIAPINKQQELTDILNAGWECHLDPDIWEHEPQIKSKDRPRILKDLMLKSMEISEVFLTVGKLDDS